MSKPKHKKAKIKSAQKQAMAISAPTIQNQSSDFDIRSIFSVDPKYLRSDMIKTLIVSFFVIGILVLTIFYLPR